MKGVVVVGGSRFRFPSFWFEFPSSGLLRGLFRLLGQVNSGGRVAEAGQCPMSMAQTSQSRHTVGRIFCMSSALEAVCSKNVFVALVSCHKILAPKVYWKSGRAMSAIWFR